MSRHIPRSTLLATSFFSLLFLSGISAAQNTLRQIEDEGMVRTSERQILQRQIDALDTANRALLDEYRSELRIVEGLETYLGLLGQQIDGQDVEIETLRTSVGDVAVVERQMLPMLARMVTSLEKFIGLDMPFLASERSQRVERLRALLERSDVTVAEKARRVFEAYQIETEFGSTIEAYKAKLPLAEGDFDADFLRIGRIALLYRTIGDGRVGHWDQSAGTWQALPSTPYRRLIEKGLRVARQEIAPELISIPLNPSKVKTR